MNNRWIKMSVLALSMSAITGTIYAEDQIQQPQVSGSNQTVVEGIESSGSSEAISSSSTSTDNTTQTSNAVDVDTNAVPPLQIVRHIKLQMHYRKKKVMLVKRLIYKKYLLQMNVNIL
ncbi:hypothetical protein HLG75_15630 [Acinetobacter baumannii]|nr:hypothetical protein HLG75_15630 [Acinetobacter baumannii]